MFGYRIKIAHNLQKNNMSINDARNYAEKLARCIDQKTAHPIVVKKKSLKRFFSVPSYRMVMFFRFFMYSGVFSLDTLNFLIASSLASRCRTPARRQWSVEPSETTR
ncbi:hypothetical protein, partial [Akkermansia sp.]|uniref:hypothetical protein n=1 Tax=Akkermansia sp. TaxID=1872421 RepID=UPI003AB686FB